jgi:hypothetical protein
VSNTFFIPAPQPQPCGPHRSGACTSASSCRCRALRNSRPLPGDLLFRTVRMEPRRLSAREVPWTVSSALIAVIASAPPIRALPASGRAICRTRSLRSESLATTFAGHSGKRSRRFCSAIPLRATAASHSNSLGARLLITVKKGRPQLKHVMAFPMSSPHFQGKVVVRFGRSQGHITTLHCKPYG